MTANGRQLTQLIAETNQAQSTIYKENWKRNSERTFKKTKEGKGKKNPKTELYRLEKFELKPNKYDMNICMC